MNNRIENGITALYGLADLVEGKGHTDYADNLRHSAKEIDTLINGTPGPLHQVREYGAVNSHISEIRTRLGVEVPLIGLDS